LFGVPKDEADAFQSSNKNESIITNYSEKLQRLFICEKVTIDERFEADSEIEAHVLSYTKSLDEQLNK